ncbi:MAG TPA: hypothetical protein VFK09_12695 [Gemmatimonadales bacterium]|nr:hypothetical protein [Gemmatimonadales bacterium]
MALRRHAVAALAAGQALATAAPASLPAQEWEHRFEVAADSGRRTIGEPVTLRFRVHLHERDLVSDSMPRPPDSLPEGVRILEISRLEAAGSRVLTGTAKVAFYRTGVQRIPPFGLPFVRVAANLRGFIVSDTTAAVEIAPTIPAGNPPLKDIRDIARVGGGPWAPWLAGAAILALAAWWLRRRRRAAPPPLAAAAEPSGPEPVVLGAYEITVARLTHIERERWPLRGEVTRHYEAVADALRRYLEDAEQVPALERTTGELVWALPPHLAAEGLRERALDLFAEADLVKFARVRPDELSASGFTRAARGLLDAWHRAVPTPETSDAVR